MYNTTHPNCKAHFKGKNVFLCIRRTSYTLENTVLRNVSENCMLHKGSFYFRKTLINLRNWFLIFFTGSSPMAVVVVPKLSIAGDVVVAWGSIGQVFKNTLIYNYFYFLQKYIINNKLQLGRYFFNLQIAFIYAFSLKTFRLIL